MKENFIYSALSRDIEREELMNRCLEQVEWLHKKFETNRILVTSDSKTFLQCVSHFDYVYIISGNVIHLAFTKGDMQSYLKSFLDLFLISKAKVSYLFVHLPMYTSGFAKHAAEITGIPYYEITF